ncbi:glycerophosphodiester phosphodiesterase family protein [Novosphingobium sp. RD2P27]|uniref:Glycerophosphodiester phosphodiesterase family protein n=1 Tax=Novosphingobium kalidii TaxID=3230299 RepID=A0ABV2D5I0_9SPHN
MRLSLFALLDQWRAPAPDPRKVAWIGKQDYAHRGLHRAGVLENSLGAFEAAIGRGLGIECDIQRSSDGQAMVFHDSELERLTERIGSIVRFSAAQLGQISLRGGCGTIPTLREVLALIAGRVPLLIEIKTRREQGVAPLCLAVRRVLEGYTGCHAVMSFDPRVARWFFLHSPHTVRGLVLSENGRRGGAGMLRRRGALWHARPDFLAYDIRDLPSRFAAGQRNRGLPITTWTVRSAEERERAVKNADAAIAEAEGVAGVANETGL